MGQVLLFAVTAAITNWSQPSDTLSYDDDNRLATWNGAPVTHDVDGNMTTGPLPDGTTDVYN
jgi:hypothetical protein